MKLQQIIKDLLFLENNPGKLREVANEYYSFLSDIAEISDKSLAPEDQNETLTKGGKAISPRDAALCVLDFARTSKFVRGIHAAILETQKRFPNEKVEILYAGSGPFATLVIPACNTFKDNEISISIIDIHQRSINCVKKVFKELELENYVNEYIKTDATTYQPDKDKKFHIIISETMQKTLAKEPQVAITLNLVKHLKSDGFFIPNKITVEAFLANINKEILTSEDSNAEKRVYLGSIFELSAETASSNEELLKPTAINVPKGAFENLDLILVTKIEIHKGFSINNYDSSLSYPTVIQELPTLKENQQIEFRYVIGEKPHFKYN